MAGIQERGGSYRILFRDQGKQHTLTLRKVSEDEAKSKSDQVDYLLMRLKQRFIELQPGIDIVQFVQFDGKPPADLQEVSAESRELTLASVRDPYLATHSVSLQGHTTDAIGLRFEHLTAALVELFPIRELRLANLRHYMDRRAQGNGMEGRAQRILGATRSSARGTDFRHAQTPQLC